MSQQVELTTGQFENALFILEREWEAYQPRVWQVRWGQLSLKFILPLLLVFILVSVFLVAVHMGQEAGEPEGWLPHEHTPMALALILVLSLLVNLPLAWKLRRQARLRAELGVDPRLEKELAKRAVSAGSGQAMQLAELPKSLVITGVVVLLIAGGALFWEVRDLISELLGPELGAILEPGADSHSGGNKVWHAVVLLLMLAGWGYAVRISSGIKGEFGKLQLVQELQTDLARRKRATSDPESGMVEVSSETYDRIARIEHRQIVRDRAKSIQEGRSAGKVASFEMRTSREFREGLANLSQDLRREVDQQIVLLATEPRRIETRTDPESGLSVVGVPNTDLEVAFSVDETAHRVEVYWLQERSAGERGETPGD